MEKEKEDKIISIDLEDDDDDDGSDGGYDDVNDYNDDSNVIGDLSQSNSDNSNLQSGSINGTTGDKKIKQKVTRAVKDILINTNTKFLNNFDPEFSNREKRKLTRKCNSEGKKSGSVHDENGVLSGVEKDVCDCLTEDCPGCHFPCPKCRSCKCGIECRFNRKWMYEVVENETEIMFPKNVDIPAN